MATAAVECDTALLTEHGFGALFEIGGEYVDIDALRQMTFGVFGGSAHVEEDQIGLLVEQRGKFAGTEGRKPLGCGAREERTETHKKKTGECAKMHRDEKNKVENC